MALSLKMASLAALLLPLLLVATSEARGWVPEVSHKGPVPVRTLVADVGIPLDAGAEHYQFSYDKCSCCSGSNCEERKCCTKVTCDPPKGGNCVLFQDCSCKC